jgi:glucose/arabinose dehydrogenase
MDPTSRRRFLRLAAAGTATGLAGCSDRLGTDPGGPVGSGGSPGGSSGSGGSPGGSPDRSLPDALALETLVSGLRAPLDVAFAPDADRRYVAEQQGIVHVHGDDGLRDEPFLDLRDTVTAGGEKGLLGIALHPGFAENRRLFVRYSAPPREGTPSGYSHTFVLAEFEATADGRRAVRDSERTVLEIPEPQGNHNAGAVAFGPDGHLYVAVGDGGAGGDQGNGHVDDWYGAVGGGNGQDVTGNLLGSILRLDVDGGASETPRTGGGGAADRKGYAVPEDNPLVGRDGLDEHYAWGLRNPYRMSFDGEDLFVGDVGQSRFEEVNLVEKGGNYGWNVKEGTHCYSANSCPDATPDDVRGGEPLRDPIVEYPHTGDGVSGISVIGGHVYRGSALPSLAGRYVFGDLRADGRLFVATPPDGDGLWPTAAVDVVSADAGKLGRILSFGRDADGEVYVLGTGQDGGGLHRIAPVA